MLHGTICGATNLHIVGSDTLLNELMGKRRVSLVGFFAVLGIFFVVATIGVTVTLGTQRRHPYSVNIGWHNRLYKAMHDKRKGNFL